MLNSDTPFFRTTYFTNPILFMGKFWPPLLLGKLRKSTLFIKARSFQLIPLFSLRLIILILELPFGSFSLKFVFLSSLFSLLTLLLLSLDLFVIPFLRVLCGFVLPRSLDCLTGTWWISQVLEERFFVEIFIKTVF